MNPNATTACARDGGSPSDGALVDLESAVVRVAERAILDAIDLRIEAGESVMVVGPNGAGKTTLLRVLLGLQPLSSGKRWARSGLRVGYVPQSLAVDPVLPMTARRFLQLAPGVMASDSVMTRNWERLTAWLTGRSLDRLSDSGGGCGEATTVEALAAQVGILDRLDRPLAVLSGGERQRLLIARALARRPELLVLDEPANALDLAGQAQLFELLDGLRERLDCALVVVSHDLQWVMASAERVLCINRHVCCSGSPETIARHPEFLRLFPDRAARAKAAERLAVYHHEHDHVHALDGRVMPAGDAIEGDSVGCARAYGDAAGHDSAQAGGVASECSDSRDSRGPRVGRGPPDRKDSGDGGQNAVAAPDERR
ncbi:MAG: metal ABC transporter ATP-binding protein [Thioalkalivibrionaceae bacterium]